MNDLRCFGSRRLRCNSNSVTRLTQLHLVDTAARKWRAMPEINAARLLCRTVMRSPLNQTNCDPSMHAAKPGCVTNPCGHHPLITHKTAAWLEAERCAPPQPACKLNTIHIYLYQSTTHMVIHAAAIARPGWLSQHLLAPNIPMQLKRESTPDMAQA
jgi:hypothetical protein